MPRIEQFKTHEEYLNWYRDYRKKNAEKFRKYNQKYSKEWRKRFGYESEERYKKKYPEKELAHQLLRYAIKTGKVKRKRCEVCNTNKKVQGHHDDYFKPLEVMWLCPLHHKDKHRKLKID